MKNKGFTLVELMAVIILLAIVTTIAYSSYRSVNKNIRKQQFENKISLIETKAAEYANDTKIMITNVDTLVKQGYLAADTEDDNVLSPIDNSSMNCYVFAMYKSEENYYGEYLEKEECDASKLDTVNGNITINKYVSVGGVRGKSLEKNDWTKEDVELEIQINNPDIKSEEINSVKWISQLGEETNNDKNKIVSASYLIDTTYTVEITMNNGIKYRAETLVRIDKARPSITKVEIENENVWETEKKVIINAHDEGSGIYGYGIIMESGRCEDATFINNSSEIYEMVINENGKYYVCAKDNAGNVSEKTDSSFIEIKKIDKEAPKCSINASTNPNGYNWYNSDVKFILNDGRESEKEQSGIQEKYVYINGNLRNDAFVFNESDGKYYWTLSYDAKGLNVKIQVKDNAGNICEKDITVNRDATKPNCTNSGDNSSWTKNPVTIYYGCSDNLSRCLTSGGSRTFRTSTKTATISGYTIKDYAGNTTLCSSREANVYLDDCSSTSRVRTSTGTCSKKCGGGTRSYTYNNVGNFSGVFVCSTGSGSEDCNTMDCCSKQVDSGSKTCGSYGSCSASCGDGTKTRKCTINRVSAYDGSSCGTRSFNESTSCNNGSCSSDSGGDSGDSGGGGGSCPERWCCDGSPCQGYCCKADGTKY